MAETLHIALLQTSLAWESPEENRRALAQKLEALRAATNLVVLPEMFTTGFTMQPERIADTEGPKTIRWMGAMALKYDVAICGSIVFQEADGLYYNRFFFVTPDGKQYTYDKRHTFTLAGEHKVYKAGTEKLLLDYMGFRICPLICYDLRFPVWSRNVEGYDLLLYVANWPAPRVHAWDILLQARAIENMAFCAGVNRLGTDANGLSYAGHSAVYDCLGHSLAFSGEDTILYASLHKTHLLETRERLKFLDDKDSFSLVR